MDFNSEIQGYNVYPMLHFRRKFSSGVTPSAYHLKLPHGMRQLHPVFNVVKLSAAPEDPILGRKPQAPLPPIVVDGEKEWEVDVRGMLGEAPSHTAV